MLHNVSSPGGDGTCIRLDFHLAVSQVGWCGANRLEQVVQKLHVRETRKEEMHVGVLLLQGFQLLHERRTRVPVEAKPCKP